jgi:hypothetical protein
MIEKIFKVEIHETSYVRKIIRTEDYYGKTEKGQWQRCTVHLAVTKTSIYH